MAIPDQHPSFEGDLSHLESLKAASDSTAYDEWRRDNPGILPNLRGIDLSGQNLMGYDFSGADLSKANLEDAKLDQARMSGVTLADASLRRAHLAHASFYSAGLVRADLRDAYLDGAVLNHAVLREAKLTGAFIGGINRERWDIEGVECDFVYTDSSRRRNPEGRDFHPGEFERLYKHYATFDLAFEQGIDSLTILVANYAAIELDVERPDIGFEVKEVSAYGDVPLIKVAVRDSQQADEGAALLRERVAQYQARLEEAQITSRWLFQALESALKGGQQITFNDATISQATIGTGSSLQVVEGLSSDRLADILDRLEGADLPADKKSAGRALLIRLKEAPTEAVRAQAVAWSQSLLQRGGAGAVRLLQEILEALS